MHDILTSLMQISREPSFNERCNTWLNKHNGTSVDRDQIQNEIGVDFYEINSEEIERLLTRDAYHQ